MKILRISLRNIASLAGNHTVDFTQAPLASAGLFSISGQTGSGKSTLLDALCLALFDETPRLALVKGAAAMRDAEGSVQQDDVRNLLRRGCGEGYAEVAFVGVDGGVYTARWTVRRAYDAPDGKLRPSEYSLFRGNLSPGENGVQVVAGTPTEVKKAIVAKVGLTFDQFRRAVLLAQGDFATFLKAKDAERAEILQALTGTERFEMISKAIFERTRAEEMKLGELRVKLGTAEPLTEEARAEALKEIRRAEEVCKELERQLAERKKQEEWFVVKAVRENESLTAGERVRECLGQVELGAPRAKELHWVETASIEARPLRLAEQEMEIQLQDALRKGQELREEERKLAGVLEREKRVHEAALKALSEASAREKDAVRDIAKARALDVELNPLQDALVVADKEHAGAKEAFSKAEKELVRLNGELAELSKKKQLLQKKVGELSLFEPFAPDAAGWLERFKTEAKLLKKTHDAKCQLGLLSKGAAQALKDLQRISEKLPELREQSAVAEKTLGEAVRKAESFNAEQILLQRRNATGLRDAFKDLSSQLENQKRALEEHAGREASLQTLEAQIASDGVLEEELLKVKIPAAQASFETAKGSLRLAEAAASEQALVLRQALVSGEACPVCGSCEHPNADGGNTVEKRMLAALSAGLQDKEAVLQQLKAELSGKSQLLNERKKQVTDTKRVLQALASEIKELGVYTPADSECAAVWRMIGEQRDAELKRREGEIGELLNSLDQRDEERIRAEKVAKALQADFDKKYRVFSAAENAEKEARNVSETAAAACLKAEQELAALESELAAASKEIRPVLEALKPGADERADQNFEFADYDYEDDREAYCEWFETGAKEWNFCTPQLANLRLTEASKLEQRAPFVEAREEAERALKARAEAHTEALRRVQEKKEARSELLGGSSADEFERKIREAMEAASSAEANARVNFTDAEKALGSQRVLLEEDAKDAASLEAQRGRARVAMDAWSAEFGLREERALDRRELDVWLGRDVRWMESERRALKEVEDKLASARGEESTLLKQLQEHLQARCGADDLETVKREVSRLSVEVASADEVLDARRLVIAKDNEHIRESDELIKELERRKQEALPWQKLNSLIGSADGAKFRNIAQQWTLEILIKHANAQLNLLSGRYRLERLRDSLNLVITDLEMGWQRSVHSLSGGESFLVSLGLALGLASLTSSRLLIESLFIDEGFGSLDSETLRVALNALSHLESQGRKVGVISHVSEMVDAIPVQVRVVRVSGGASRIVI